MRTGITNDTLHFLGCIDQFSHIGFRLVFLPEIRHMLQCLFDLVVETRTRDQFPIPPDAPPLGLERLDQPQNAVAVEGKQAEKTLKLMEALEEQDDVQSVYGTFDIDEKEMEKVEILADKKCTDPVQAIQQKDVLELITCNLTKKERLIIIMYYYEGLTMREIGEIMELTESRVCQIHSNVMARLKGQLDTIQFQSC